MCAKTTVMASPNFTENKFWLNGKEESFDNRRLQSCLKEGKLVIIKLCYLWVLQHMCFFYFESLLSRLTCVELKVGNFLPVV